MFVCQRCALMCATEIQRIFGASVTRRVGVQKCANKRPANESRKRRKNEPDKTETSANKHPRVQLNEDDSRGPLSILRIV